MKEFDLTRALTLIDDGDEGRINWDKDRFTKLREKFYTYFPESKLHYFSTPGRTELGGNHTDHNNGRVLAASINLDSKAVVSKSENMIVDMYSEGYGDPFLVDLSDLKYREEESGTTNALIRGVAARFTQLGYSIGGFNTVMASDVLPGSGLSSSASVEILMATIFNALYNGNSINPEILARIGQFAENEYFGKPSGLMDQMACAVGGIIVIDFQDPDEAKVQKVDFDINSVNYNLLVVDTGGNHADLTEDYAAVPSEMKRTAKLFGKNVLRDVQEDDFIGKIPEIRKSLGDRAVLRALHFFQENKRVDMEVAALRKDEFVDFLDLVGASGNSSFKLLQNIYTSKNIDEQGISLALALSEQYIREKSAGACRVHGGGFAGTIQVYLPVGMTGEYVELMEKVFGSGCTRILKIRPFGTVYLNEISE